MRVLYHQSVENTLFELIEVLYNEKYFGFYQAAINYVTELRTEIESSIVNLPKKKAPVYFDKYRNNLFYVAINKNKNTQWYVFFDQIEDDYFIYLIANNHTISQHL